jgi:hypothetical protein
MILLYLDPGSASFMIQLLFAAITYCGIPLAIIGAIVAYIRHLRKRDIPKKNDKEAS